jgi:indole-3-acetate monooxygenase
MISSGLSLSMGRFPAQIGRHICGQPIDLRAAGSLRALGRAYQTDSGYRVKGHWNFANGIRHAN